MNPQLYSVPQYGLGNASWYTPGPGTIGDYGYNMEKSVNERNRIGDLLAQLGLEEEQAISPNRIAESDLKGTIARYLNTPERAGQLGEGQLGGAIANEIKGKLARGTEQYQLNAAKREDSWQERLSQLNNQYQSITDLLAAAQLGGEGPLAPGAGAWSGGVGKVLEAMGVSPDSPQYAKANEEWAAPTPELVERFKKIQEAIALRTQEHLRARDLQQLKNQGAVDTASASGKDKESAKIDKLIPMYREEIKDVTNRLKELNDMYGDATLRLQLRLAQTKEGTPERQRALDAIDNLEKTYNTKVAELEREREVLRNEYKQVAAKLGMKFASPEPVSTPQPSAGNIPSAGPKNPVLITPENSTKTPPIPQKRGTLFNPDYVE